jgi:hypothetical protein
MYSGIERWNFLWVRESEFARCTKEYPREMNAR